MPLPSLFHSRENGRKEGGPSALSGLSSSSASGWLVWSFWVRSGRKNSTHLKKGRRNGTKEGKKRTTMDSLERKKVEKGDIVLLAAMGIFFLPRSHRHVFSFPSIAKKIGQLCAE